MIDDKKTPDEIKKANAAVPHPGMMGDGTEEQNLDQPGNPDARIGKDELKDAFSSPKKSG